MFGLIISGRMVTTNFEAVGENNFVATIPDAQNVNNIVIFMTGQVAFPPDCAALIFFSWPNADPTPTWHLLGYLGNDKPSSIFKISGLKQKPAEQPFNQFSAQAVSPIARIGISIESINNVRQQMMLLENSKSSPATTEVAEFSQKMLEGFLNYAGSFAISQSQMIPNPSEMYVPLSVVKNWYDNFLRKLSLNPNFWKS